MAQGSKASYTSKQKRQARHIADGYKKQGASTKMAEARAWATVNQETGGGNRSGSGRGKQDTHVSSRRGGKAAASHRAHATSVRPGRKAAATRKRRAA